MLNPQIFTSSPTSLKMYVALFQLILFDSVNFGDWERHVGVMKLYIQMNEMISLCKCSNVDY